MSLSFIFLMALAGTGAVQAGQVAGYGRDGTRIYPGVTPPTTWSVKDNTKWTVYVVPFKRRGETP